jgi:hypothetical protein
VEKLRASSRDPQKKQKREQLMAFLMSLKSFCTISLPDVLDLFNFPVKSKGFVAFTAKFKQIENNGWIPLFFETTVTTALEGGKNVSAGFAKISQRIGHTIMIAGWDTLHYFAGKFNVFRFGLENESESAKKKNALWVRFKQLQKDSLFKLLKNIGNQQSNARNELQDMCIRIGNMNEKAVEKDRCNGSFEDLYQKCSELNAAGLSEQELSQKEDEAKGLLDKILELNYKHVYLKNRSLLYKV